jgi:hypothetical protein
MKLGIMTSSLGPTQEAFYIVNQCNKAVATYTHDPIVFFQEPDAPCLDPVFTIMNVYEAWTFKEPLIATTLNLATKLAKLPMAPKKLFYMWDLEWLRMQNKNFQQLADLYRNPAFKIIARSKSHADLIANCWNVDVVGVVENFDLDQFVEIINGQKLSS